MMNRNIVTRTPLLFVVLLGMLCVFTSIAGAAQETSLQSVPSYANPITKKIEDIGDNAGLGQGMTENLIQKTPTSLLVDDAGNTFITLRVGLVKESQDLRFELLDAKGKPEKALPYTIVAEQPDDNSQDLQMQVPDEKAILRVSLVSKPMGREVIGFVSFAGEKETVTAPTAEEETVDDSAISVYENAGKDEVAGVSDEARGSLLMFLGIAAIALIFVFVIIFVVSELKKKKKESN